MPKGNSWRWHVHEWLTLEGITYPRGSDDTIKIEVCSKCGINRPDDYLLKEAKKGMKK